MAEGISAVLTFAVGVAISPVPIIAVTLMLFSRRARVNGPAFLLGWVLAVAVVSGVAYTLADQADAATSSTAADTIAWGKIVFGVLFLLLAARNWRSRPAPGTQPEMPKWMAGVDGLTPPKAFGLGLLLAGPNPKNLMLCSVGRGGTRRTRSPSRRGRRLADRLHRHRQPQHRGAGLLLPDRRRATRRPGWTSSRTGSSCTTTPSWRYSCWSSAPSSSPTACRRSPEDRAGSNVAGRRPGETVFGVGSATFAEYATARAGRSSSAAKGETASPAASTANSGP